MPLKSAAALPRNDEMRRRIDAASRFVVFQNILGPFWGMLKKEEAFSLILARCDYEPEWSSTPEAVTLRFRRVGSAPDEAFAPESFSAPPRWGYGSDRLGIISLVFQQGLQGWFAMPSDRFTIVHGIERQKARKANVR